MGWHRRGQAGTGWDGMRQDGQEGHGETRFDRAGHYETRRNERDYVGQGTNPDWIELFWTRYYRMGLDGTFLDFANPAKTQ